MRWRRSVSGELVEPAYHWCPPYRDTLGAQVAKLAAAAGFAPDAEQALLLDDIFGANDGDMAAFETAVVCARQNLKTGLFKQAALGWLFVTKEPLIVWSSHLFKTTMDPERRELLRVILNDDNAVRADEMFTILMGDVVEPRKNYIVDHALNVRNLDI